MTYRPMPGAVAVPVVLPCTVAVDDLEREGKPPEPEPPPEE